MRKLYLRGKFFGCRHCHGLAYRSSGVAPGGETLGQATEEAAAVAFTKEEAREYADRSERDPPVSLKTVESVVEELRAGYRSLVSHWA